MNIKKLGNLLVEIEELKKELANLQNESDGNYYFLKHYRIDYYSCKGVYNTLYLALSEKIRLMEETPIHYITYQGEDSYSWHRNCFVQNLEIDSFKIKNKYESNTIAVFTGSYSNLTEIVFICYGKERVWKKGDAKYIIEDPEYFEIQY